MITDLIRNIHHQVLIAFLTIAVLKEEKLRIREKKVGEMLASREQQIIHDRVKILFVFGYIFSTHDKRESEREVEETDLHSD